MNKEQKPSRVTLIIGIVIEIPLYVFFPFPISKFEDSFIDLSSLFLILWVLSLIVFLVVGSIMMSIYALKDKKNIYDYFLGTLMSIVFCVLYNYILFFVAYILKP
jgi:uncharacterized BrkB/YihY/UPF0761 family membrane protein